MKTHKLYRDEGSEYPYESETVVCDPRDVYARSKLSTDWAAVTCKICLSMKPKKKEAAKCPDCDGPLIINEGAANPRHCDCTDHYPEAA